MADESKRPRYANAGTTVSALLARQAKAAAEQLDDEDPPSEILEGLLFLGDVENASRPSQLQRYGISHVLNVTQSRDLGTDVGVERLFLYANDSETEQISVLFPSACAFIEKAREADGRVLVHCLAGRSRSATLVLAYLMRHKKMFLLDAFCMLKQKRPIVLPNIGFWEQLVAEEVRLFGTPSGTPSCYEQILAFRHLDQEPSASLLFRKYCTACAISDEAESEMAQTAVLQQWPQGWSGAQAVEEVLTESLENLHPNARLAAVRLVYQLIKSQKLAHIEASQGIQSVALLDRSELRIDIPMIDEYMSEVLQEATRLKLIET